jgi:hypothetical protein
MKSREWFKLMGEMKFLLTKTKMREKSVFKTKRKTEAEGREKKIVKATIKLTEKERHAIYAHKADNMRRERCDHAMGLKVLNCEGICYNNGYGVLQDFCAKFSAENLAKQMIGLSVCYVIKLCEVTK